MRHLLKGGFLNFKYSCSKLLKNSCLRAPRIVHSACLSISSDRPSSHPLANSTNLSFHRNSHGFDPLFNEILGILGAEDFVVEKGDDRYGYLVSGVMNSEGYEMTEGVCENAQEKIDSENTQNLQLLEESVNGSWRDIQLKDINPVVQKVAEIVRGQNEMEERLENASFEYTEEIVGNVLKRCFKVPHLGLRFFNWVKSKERFQHTTNTFNVTINLAGEAKEFGLMERFLEEMEQNSCDKDIKTWTLLISHYGKARLFGKALLAFDKMKKSGLEPDAKANKIMLRSLCNGGKADLALEFYKEMVNNGVEIGLVLYRQLLNCLALSGHVAAVHAVGDDMIRVAGIPEFHVYYYIMKSFCIAGRITEALELIRDLKKRNIPLESYIFESLVKGLCRANRISDAVEIMEIMKKRNSFDQRMHETLITGYLRRNEVFEAFKLFQEIKGSGNVSIATYTNLMQNLFWNDEFQKGMELYKDMIENGATLDSVAITAVASGFLRENCIDEAWEVFNTMGEKGIKASSRDYVIFLKELCKFSKTDELVKVLKKMHACKLKIPHVTFEHIKSYLRKEGETEKLKAIELMQRACSCSTDDKGGQILNRSDQLEVSGKMQSGQIDKQWFLNCLPEPPCGDHDVPEVCRMLSSSNDWFFIQENLEKCNFHYTPDLVLEILDNCRLNGGNALKFFSWIGKQTGYRHNTQVYNMAMKIAGQGKDFKQMRSLFYEMKRRGCSVTSDTWTIMILQYGRTGLTDIALNHFREMKLSGCEPTKSTYNSLITSLCGRKGRKIDEAIQLYQEMVQLGFVPDKELLEHYIGCLCEVDKLLDARKCIESLSKFGFTVPLRYSLYFRALCRADKLDDALALLHDVGAERNVLDQYTYGSLIHGLLRKGRLEEALAKMRSMKQVGISPTVHVYTSLIIYFFKEKEVDKALKILEEMNEVGCLPTIVTYSAVLCGFVRMGQLADAWNVFHHLKQNGPSPDFRTYTMFINCLCRIGKSEEALKLIPEMLLNGIIPSTINFRQIMYGLNREGRPDLARVVLKKKLDLKRRRKMHLCG